ncbi:LytR/AlgR family response regulator transcription factor [Algoriphagus sediminis]|uniref:LytTR family DNA-binding domain-containing protein n=1 Tax=Algoriphagus sediminis TaxID=3057113 RepID=A0ABT7YBZ9_9BACT|nr:LytTR family DNA-binding domain-containing protein [Algoriphagus sediminis]MDN3204050.1 LytTR family DNA-binding domain-containing protein [Algoriphagus sediminis]
MNILIIEDENPAAARLKRLLQARLPEAEMHGNLDTVQSSIDWLNTNPEPDLIFCDIQLADGISFEIFQEVDIKSPVIFTTAFDQYAIRAFEVNAVDYLLKPLDPDALEKALEKFRSNQIKTTVDITEIKSLLQSPSKKYKSRFLVKFGEKIQSINVTEAAFFYSESRATYLQTHAGKRYILDSNLETLENQLDPDEFFRINRKYLISPDSIEEIYAHSNSRLKIKLLHSKDSDVIVSRERVADFKNWLDK